MLSSMGAQISGAGTSVIEVQGVDRLSAIEHAVVPDRIAAGHVGVRRLRHPG